MTQKMGLREFIDVLQAKGYTVGGSKQEDPVLLMPDGKAVETWKEGYPYDELMPREERNAEWIGYEGYSSRNNHLTLRMKYADLKRGDLIEPSLAISPDYTDTYEVDNGLRCQRQ